MRDGSKVIISECEKPLTKNNYLTFEDKYLSDRSLCKRKGPTEKFSSGLKGGMMSLTREFPAKIPEKMREQIRGFTEQIYEKCGLKGVVRVDYLVSDGMVYVNEINTIPGSLAYYLFENITLAGLIEIMIKTALYDKANLDAKESNFASVVLGKV